MARPRRAILSPWARVRKTALACGLTILVIVGASYIRIALPGQQEKAASVQAFSDPVSQGVTQAPDPEPSLLEPATALSEMATPTPTPSATPKATPTPSRATVKAAATAAKATTTKPAAVKTSSVASKPSGKCPTLVGGGGARVRALHQHLCGQFPQVTTYYGMRADPYPDHPSGRAVDIMVYSNTALGSEIASYLQNNASSLGIDYLIWNQRIWSVSQSSKGWRAMSDRGGATANHRDHIHAMVRA